MIYKTKTHREITAIDSLEETARKEEHSESPAGGKHRSSEWERLLHKLTKPRQLFLGHPGSAFLRSHEHHSAALYCLPWAQQQQGEGKTGGTGRLENKVPQKALPPALGPPRWMSNAGDKVGQRPGTQLLAPFPNSNDQFLVGAERVPYSPSSSSFPSLLQQSSKPSTSSSSRSSASTWSGWRSVAEL